MFRDKDIRAKKKRCQKKSRTKCVSKKSGGQPEPELVANGSSLDRDAVHCQYLMAESFVKSILDWKCQIPRDEFKDIADVMLKRLASILEYSPSNGEDRKSQQMRFLADVIASWIVGVLFEVAEAKKTELEEECERRRKEQEEETEEESDDESEDTDDDDDDRPKGGGGGRRKEDEDKRKKGGKDGKDDDDDDQKPGRPVGSGDAEEAPEAGGLKDPKQEVTEDPAPSKPEPGETAPPQEVERESKEEETFHDARTELGSPLDEDEKKTLARKLEDTELMMNGDVDNKKPDKALDEVQKDPPIEKYSEPEVREPFAAVLEPDKLRDTVKGEFAIGKQRDDGLLKKPVEVSQVAETKFAEIGDEMKSADGFVDRARPLAAAEEITGRKSMEIGEGAAPTTLTTSPVEDGRMPAVEISSVSKSEKDVMAAAKKVDDRETAATPTKISEAAEAPEAKQEDTGASTVLVDDGDAGTEALKAEFDEERQTRKSTAPSKVPTKSVDAEEFREKKADPDEHDQPKNLTEPFQLEPVQKLEEIETDMPKKIIDPFEDPSALVTIESLRDKRKEESEKKTRPSRLPPSGKSLIGKMYETDVPFVKFDKIFHTIYNAIEASDENPGVDSITNRLHRAVYEKFANVVQEENRDPLPALTRDVLDVMSGKIALWLRDILTDSQLSFVNKFPATVESVEVREWNDWIGDVFDTANTWSAWIQQTIRQAEGMRSNEVTRGDWRDWTKSVETDALRWRRFYLDSVHRAHQNLTMIRDRHVVKTGTRNPDERKNEYEEEMKITDLETER